MMSETDSYYRDGLVSLPALFPEEVLHAFYERMQADIGASGKSMQAFAAQGPLLKQAAVEINSHQYPPMRTLLWGLTPRIAQATARTLMPTYAYFRLYRGGDICRVHTDRPACEHSVSLTLAYGEGRPWPLAVGTDRVNVPTPTVTEDFGGETFVAVAMAPGDGVLYQGVHHRHGRPTPNPNSWSAHLFLHWVERGGRYGEQAFDAPALARVRR